MPIKSVKGGFFKPYLEILRSRNVALILAVENFRGFWSAYLSWYLSILIYEVGGAGLLAATYGLMYFLGMFLPTISGLLSDKIIGRKKMMIFANSFSSLCLALLTFSAYSKSALLAVISIILLRIPPSLREPIIGAMILEACPKESVGKAFSILPGISLTISSLGGITCGYMISKIGGVNMLVINTIALAIAVPPYFFLREKGVERGGKTGFTLNALKDKVRNLRESVKLIKKSSPLMMFALFTIVDSFTTSWISPYFAVYMSDVHKLEPFIISIAYTASSIAQALGNIMAGPFVDRYGSVNAFIMQNLIVPPMLLCFSLLKPPLSIIGYVISSFTSGLFNVGYFKHLTLITDDRNRATIIGGLNTLQSMARMLGPPIGAHIWKISPQTLFITYVAVGTPLIFSILLAMRKVHGVES